MFNIKCLNTPGIHGIIYTACIKVLTHVTLILAIYGHKFHSLKSCNIFIFFKYSITLYVTQCFVSLFRQLNSFSYPLFYLLSYFSHLLLLNLISLSFPPLVT